MAWLGIDFGTSTTVAALTRGGRPQLVPDSEGNEVMPSVVAFTPSGRVAVGQQAKVRRIIDPQNTVYSVKRIIGKQWLSPTVTRFRQSYPFVLERGDDGQAQFVTRAGKMNATQVGAHIIAAVRDAQTLQGVDIEGVMVTVPTSFDPAQRQATVAAANVAGFAKVSVIEEPYAAALPYIIDDQRERVIVVYDLGGGTFDLAVLRCQGTHFEVLAFGGDAYLGGDDIDLKLAEWAAHQVLESHRWDVKADAKAFQTLLLACERAKIRLSELDETSLNLTQVDPVLSGKDLVVKRAHLEDLIGQLVRRTFIICDEVLAQAGVTADEVGDVILAGGGTYIPLVRDGLRDYFGRAPRADMPPDRIIAMGAAMRASRLGVI